MMPVRAARMRVGSAATRAAVAAALSPRAMASSTWRSEVRMRERRALFTSVRRAILRVAFLADLVLAIDPSFGFASVIAKGTALSPAQKKRRRRDRRRNCAAYSGVAKARQRQARVHVLPHRAFTPGTPPAAN